MAYYSRLGIDDGVCYGCGGIRPLDKDGACKPCAKQTAQFKARMAAKSMREAREAVADMAGFPGE